MREARGYRADTCLAAEKRSRMHVGWALSAPNTFLIISSLKYFWQLKLLSGEALTNTAIFHGHAKSPFFIYYVLLAVSLASLYTYTRRHTKYNIGNFGNFSGGSDGKESARNTEDPVSWVGKIPWRREQLPTPLFLPGEFHGQRSLVS